MQREGAEGRPTRPEELEKLRGLPWLMGDLTEKNLYRGTLEGGQQASYMALIMADNKLTTFPISAWYGLQVAVCWRFGDVLRECLF